MDGWKVRGFSFQGRCWLRVLKNKPVKLQPFSTGTQFGAKTGLVQLKRHAKRSAGVLEFGLASCGNIFLFEILTFSFCGHTREITQAMDLCVSYELDIQVSRIMQ